MTIGSTLIDTPCQRQRIDHIITDSHSPVLVRIALDKFPHVLDLHGYAMPDVEEVDAGTKLVVDQVPLKHWPYVLHENNALILI